MRGGLPAATLVDIPGGLRDVRPKLDGNGTFPCGENLKSGCTYQEVMEAVADCRNGGAERQRREMLDEDKKKNERNEKRGRRRTAKLLFATSCALLAKVMSQLGGKGRGEYNGTCI